MKKQRFSRRGKNHHTISFQKLCQDHAKSLLNHAVEDLLMPCSGMKRPVFNIVMAADTWSLLYSLENAPYAVFEIKLCDSIQLFLKVARYLQLGFRKKEAFNQCLLGFTTHRPIEVLAVDGTKCFNQALAMSFEQGTCHLTWINPVFYCTPLLWVS